MIQTKNLAMVFVAVMVGTVGGAYGFIQDAQVTESQMETANIYGHVEMVVRDADGNIKEYLLGDNIIVDKGFQTMADLMFVGLDQNGSGANNQFSYIGIGSSIAAAVVGDTDVVTAIGGCSRVQDGSISAVNNSGNVVVTIDASFSGGTCANGAVSEAVLANASTAGEILARKLFASTVNLLSTDTLTVTWTITLSA